MEGKGWFIIYGVLVLVVVYLFITQQSLNANIKQLQADVTQLKSANQATPQAETTESASPDATPSPDLATAKGRDAKRKSDVLALNAALAQYHTEKGSYPKTLQELVPDYLTELPKDPDSPKYTYRYQRVGNGYRLTCYIEENDYPDDRNSDGKQDHIFTITEKTTR
ncbi:hypothetical protein EXS54_02545 [Patescibacteria group bacterium]|nr:hypothetical protein [Patescibacteria group bacterium]